MIQQVLFQFAELSGVTAGGLPRPEADGAHLQTILTFVFTIVGALAVLMIVVSGFRYVISSGDPQKAANARTGVINALVGLAFAAAAQALVIFVVKRV